MNIFISSFSDENGREGRRVMRNKGTTFKILISESIIISIPNPKSLPPPFAKGRNSPL